MAAVGIGASHTNHLIVNFLVQVGSSSQEKCTQYGAQVAQNRIVVPKVNQVDWADTRSSCWIAQPTQRKPTDTSTCQCFLCVCSATGQCCAGQAKSSGVSGPARTLSQWGEVGGLPFQSLLDHSSELSQQRWPKWPPVVIPLMCV